MKNKKGDLSLSINAIVILILAITMLGLGLAFMRNIFGKATSEFQEVSGTVKKQMIDQMKESEQVVELSRPKIDLKPGGSTQVFIGFKNDGSSTQKYFKIRDTSSRNTSLAGKNLCPLSKVTSGQAVYLEFKTTDTTVQQGDVVVLPINIKALSSALTDTCFYELDVAYDSVATTTTSPSKIVELTVDITQ